MQLFTTVEYELGEILKVWFNLIGTVLGALYIPFEDEDFTKAGN